MMVTVKINYSTGTRYFSLYDTVVIDSKQYASGILKKIDGLRKTITTGSGTTHKLSKVSLHFSDFNYMLRENVNINVVIEVLYNNSIIGRYIVSKATIVNSLFVLYCTESATEILNQSIFYVLSTEFPESEDTTLPIPIFFGTNTRPFAKALLIDHNNPNADYIVAKFSTTTLSFSVIDKVYDETGADVTSRASLYDDIVTVDGRDITRVFMEVTAEQDHTVTFSMILYPGFLPASSMVTQTLDLWSIAVDVPSNFDNHMYKNLFVINDDDNFVEMVEDHRLHFCYQEAITGETFLNDMRTCLDIGYKILNRRLVLIVLDLSNIVTVNVPDNYFTSFIEEATNVISNDKSFLFDYDQIEKTYIKVDDFLSPCLDYSIDTYGKQERGNPIEFRWTNNRLTAHVMSKNFYVKNSLPKIVLKASMSIDDYRLIGLDIGVSFTTNSRNSFTKLDSTYTIETASFNYAINKVDIMAENIDNLTTLDTDCYLLLQSYNSVLAYNNAADSNCELVGTTKSVIDSDGVHGYMFDQTGTAQSYFYVSDPVGTVEKFQGNKWDFTAHENWSVSFNCKVFSHDNDNYQFAIEFGQDFLLFQVTGSIEKFRVLSRVNGVFYLNLTDPVVYELDTLYHIYIVKVSDDYAFYVNGVQSGFYTNANHPPVIGSLDIGGWLSNRTTGRIDEFRIGKDNILNASPNVSLTDTVTVPVNGFNWYGVV